MGIREVLYQLKKDVTKKEKIFQSLRAKHSSLSQFKDFDELLKFLHQKENTNYLLKDTIILSLLSEHKTSGDKNLISPFIIVIFEPAVAGIFYLYSKRLPSFPQLSFEDLAMLIISLFLEQIEEVLPSEKVFPRITGKLKNKIRKYFHNLSIEAKAEREYRPEITEEDLPTIEPNTFLKAIDELVKEGRLSETQRQIILSSVISGQSLKSIAKSLNLTPANVRQKKHRGLEAVRTYLKIAK